MQNNWHTSKAQTAVELAVFGAVMIFVIGTIVRQTMNYSLQQTVSIKAMRMAMQVSFLNSEGWSTTGGGKAGNASRNTANILFIEDRLNVDSGKYASVDRVPFVVNASATDSRNLFLPVDLGETWNLPVADMFINGEHFSFLLANFTLKQFNNALPNWDNNCGTEKQQIDCTNASNCPTACTSGCSSNASSVQVQVPFGCARFYSINPNTPSNDKWCDDVLKICPTATIGSGMTSNERFDYNRNGVLDPDEPQPYPASDMRASMLWQWYPVGGYDETSSHSSGGNAVAFTVPDGVNMDSNKNTVLDVDGDFKEERIMKIQSKTSAGVITEAYVMDFQDGDLDFTHTKKDRGPDPGFTNNLTMYTFVQDGNQLKLEEGSFYAGSNRRYKRSTQKKNQLDIITREIQLSNNTGRFCDASGAPTPLVDDQPNPVEVCCSSAGCKDAAGFIGGTGGTGVGAQLCFSNLGNPPVATRTCMLDDIANINNNGVSLWNSQCVPGDCAIECTYYPSGCTTLSSPTTHKYPMIFVRSRLSDKRGITWITDITDNPNLFTGNANSN